MSSSDPVSDTPSRVSPSATETPTLHENVFGCGGCGLTSSEPLTGHDCAASALGRDKPNEDESALLGALNVTSSYIESLPVAFAEGFQTILLSLAALREENASLRSPSSPVPSSETSRQFQSVSVTRFEIDHLRNFVVLLAHKPDMRTHADALQKWIEDKTSRPSIESRPPIRGTEPKDFEKLLETMLVAHEEVVANAKGCDTRPGSGKRLNATLAAVRGYVSRLQTELRINALTFEQKYIVGRLSAVLVGTEDGLPIEWDKLVPAAVQLSRIQQTGLTAEEATKILDLMDGNVVLFESDLPVIEKLRSLAALRSLEGDKND